MKALLAWITSSVRFVIPTASDEAAGRHDLDVTVSRFDAVWDEAVMAAMYDETARSFLDLMGPRGK
jgi:hypothetical protein